MKVKKQPESKKVNLFDLKEGDVFTYSEIYVLDDVKRVAEDHGIEIKCMSPSTDEYHKYGSFTCKVVGFKQNDLLGLWVKWSELYTNLLVPLAHHYNHSDYLEYIKPFEDELNRIITEATNV